MATVRLKYLWVPTIKGRQFCYYRRAGLRTRLPLPTEPGFWRAYQAAHAEAEAQTARSAPGRPGVIPGSLRALIAAYRRSSEWRELSPGSQGNYAANLDQLAERFGHLAVATMPRAFVFKLRDEYATKDGRPTPRRANSIVDVLRLLLSWGVDRGWRKDNPALRPGRLKTGPGIATWTERDVAAFLGSPAVPASLKLAALLGLCTGQRKGDCLAMTKAARSGGAIEIVQQKTGARVWIPEHPELTRALDAAPRTDALTLLTRADGQPWRKHHFNHAFVAAVRAAGLSGLSFHGLRKTAAARLAEAGCSANEIMSITGHRTVGEVTRYTAGADQRSRATAAIEKLTARRIENAE